MLFALLFSLATLAEPSGWPAGPTALPADTLTRDSLRTDTLREVVIRPLKTLPIEGMKLHVEDVKNPPSLGNVLEKLSPGLNDKILHPFAFKARKKERQHRRMMKVLEDYDKVKTFDDLLREAYERQMAEDALTAPSSPRQE